MWVDFQKQIKHNGERKMKKYLTGQDVIKNPSGSAIAGFNRKIGGWPRSKCFEYDNERFDRELNAGWNLAEDMINAGKIYYLHNFHNMECEGYAFEYGGFWVCNTCGKQGVDKEWWKIKVMKDGNEFCCVGLDFENLQESEDYAFGETREEAIENYGKLMIGKHA